MLSLKWLDVQNPSAPTLIAKSDALEGVVTDVVLTGNRLVAGAGRGVAVLDVSDPSNPTETGYLDTNGGAYDVALIGNYAFIGGTFSSAHQIWVVDVSTPAVPTMVTSRPASHLPKGYGRYRYYQSPDALAVWHVSNVGRV